MGSFLKWNGSEGVLEISSALTVDEVKYEQDLIGTKDGSNRIFTTPDYFLPDTIRVYRNGDRQDDGDYVLSESGGVGTGYDTITFGPENPPLSNEKLFADYVIDT